MVVLQRSPRILPVKATSVKMITWMVEEEPEDIMVPVGFTMIHEAFHVVILKGVDLLLCHMREDAWTTSLYLFIRGTGVMTGGSWIAEMLSTCQRCAQWQLILLLQKIGGFRGGKNFLCGL